MTFNQYPIRIMTYVDACETAREESREHPDHFIYLIKSNHGFYLVDHLGLPKFSDEKVIMTYRQGERIL